MTTTRTVPTTRRRRSTAFADVDLDACVCLDVGHAWRWVELIAVTGPLSKIPHHVYLCMACGSRIVRSEGWDGAVIERAYDLDPSYLENAQMLGSTVGERRRNWRAERNRRTAKAV